MDERVLVGEMKAGSQKAFETLFECYLEKVVKTAYLITGNRQDSEDIAQETFVQCYLHKQELKEMESFKSWIYCIATRIAWRYCKKRNREIPMEELEEEFIERNETLDRILQQETTDYVMAAAFCILLGSTAFAYSLGHLTSLVSTVGPGYQSENFMDIDTAEQKLGYEIDKIEAFSNGYQFKKMYVEGVKGLDGNNNTVGTYRELTITYQQNGSEVYFSACKPFTEELGKSKGVKATVADRGIAFWLRADTYKMVPVGYELTEEDKENMKKEDYFISEGGDKLEYSEVSHVNWEKNGIRYGLMAYDWQGEKEELIKMAKEIAFNE